MPSSERLKKKGRHILRDKKKSGEAARKNEMTYVLCPFTKIAQSEKF